MNKIVLVILVALCLLSCGKAAPSIIQLLQGDVIEESGWQGKWVYINYWAEWCKPCAEEIPELNRFAGQASDVLLLGVHYDKPPVTDILRHANALRINFAVATSELQPIFNYPLPQSLPATIIINPEGKYVTTLQGPQTLASLTAAKQPLQ